MMMMTMMIIASSNDYMFGALMQHIQFHSPYILNIAEKQSSIEYLR